MDKRTKYISLKNPFTVFNRVLNIRFDSTVLQDGFVVNISDSCVYSKVIDSDCVIICVHVHDMLIFGTNMRVVNETKKLLSSHFEMKDVGEANVILGINIRKANHGFFLESVSLH